MSKLPRHRIKDRAERICSMWLSGVDTETIAIELDTGRGAITRTAHQLGLPPRRPAGNTVVYINWWPIIVRLIRAGRTPDQIADAIGLERRARQILLGQVVTYG